MHCLAELRNLIVTRVLAPHRDGMQARHRGVTGCTSGGQREVSAAWPLGADQHSLSVNGRDRNGSAAGKASLPCFADGLPLPDRLALSEARLLGCDRAVEDLHYQGIANSCSLVQSGGDEPAVSAAWLACHKKILVSKC